jgi:hypothetical protein
MAMKDDTKFTRDEVSQYCEFDKSMAQVTKVLSVAVNSRQLTRFISRYASLNNWFGSGVSALAGKIGRSRGIFVDPSESILDLADRSVLVASYFFDAARDEFDDRDTAHRDTHRCLAQAFMKGLIVYWATPTVVANLHLEPPLWLTAIGDRVSTGYGVSTSEHGTDLFRSMGYHLGSEILAEAEFTMIDQMMRQKMPEVVEYLSTNKFKIADQEHEGYAWIGLHSSKGESKEAEHFAWATQGVECALRYVPQEHRETYRHQVHLGIGSFARDHQEFFAHVLQD